MRLFFLILLISTSAVAQTSAGNNLSLSYFPSFNASRIQEKFKINYFGETLGPSIKKWDDNEVNDLGVKQRTPMMTYHSFNIRYLATERFNLFVSPRVNTVIGDRNDLADNADKHVVMMDDWQFGFFYTFYRSQFFQYNQRLTHRQPFSVASKNSGIDSQVEWQHDFTYAVSPALRIIHWNNYRYYAYEKQVNEDRFRVNFTTLFNYDFNDKWKAQFIHEFDIQHKTPKEGPQARDWNYLKRNKNFFSTGIGYSPIPTLSIVPFIRIMDERNIRNETTMVGLWMIGKLI